MMSIEEARKIITRRNRWCLLLRRISWKARLLDDLADNDYLYRFGKDLHILYEELHPETPIERALHRILVEPLMRHVGWAELGKQILTITPLEDK
jgi:hypothetical protein